MPSGGICRGPLPGPATTGGLQIPCLLELGWSEELTQQRAARAGIQLPGLSRLYAGEQKQPGWLLGYASLSAHEIEAIMVRLAQVLKI